MNLATKKIHKAINNLKRALCNIENGNKRLAVGDLDFCKSNCQKAIWLLLDQIEQEQNN